MLERVKGPLACLHSGVQEGYTSPQRLCIWGRSAGGLTMGATINMRSDLFRVRKNPILAAVLALLAAATMLLLWRLAPQEPHAALQG